MYVEYIQMMHNPNVKEIRATWNIKNFSIIVVRTNMKKWADL